jgi:hypothetical protein
VYTNAEPVHVTPLNGSPVAEKTRKESLGGGAAADATAASAKPAASTATAAARVLTAALLPAARKLRFPPVALAVPPHFPAPPRGAVVLARESGADAVALAVVPGRRLLLQVSVLGPEGPAAGRRVTVTLGGTLGRTTAAAAPCGTGCYGAALAPRGRPSSVAVQVGRAKTLFALPAAWPPTRADGIVRRADAAWRRLRTFQFRERLASSRTAFINTLWRVQAPNRIRYDIAGGASGIIVGPWRWDRGRTGPWRRSPQEPIQQPLPFWVAHENAHLLGRVRSRGVAALHVSFYDPASHAWFDALFDPHTLLTLRLDMTTTAHFMHHLYFAFDEPLRIEPPAPG